MRRLIAAATAFAAACLVAGVSQIPQPIIVRGQSNARPRTARIAIIGDPQNYFSRVDALVGGNLAVAAELARLEIDDIIAYRPDFVLIVGDLTDGPSSGDENCGAWRMIDDLDLATTSILGQPPGYFSPSWVDVRQKMYDRLIAAGLPVFTVLGNHDSCVEYERYFPPGEWNGYTQWSAESFPRSNACGGATTLACGSFSGSATHTDTSSRKALYPTPIGTICVLGMAENAADLDAPWLRGKIGCGSDRPTIVMSHAGGGLDTLVSTGVSTTQKNDVIADVFGHYTPNPDIGVDAYFSFQVAHGGAIVPHVRDIFANAQEQISGDIGGFGGISHTGMSWWWSWEIDPAANTAQLQAHNPYLGGSSQPIPQGRSFMGNTTQTFSYSWCTRFGGAACP